MNYPLTVFTTTFNRAYIIDKLYMSLVAQTNKNFIWLIIDDGSTDNTKDLIKSWIEEDVIKIRYFYKSNGGMHTGHNTAYELIDTELNVCIDSDDHMPHNAVDLIIKKWSFLNDKNKFAGIIGLDAFNNGKIVGTEIPDNLKQGTLLELYEDHGVKGDKKIVLRTDLAKKYPRYPKFGNEKLVPLDVLYLMIGKDYDFLYSNVVYCIVEYQLDGSSNTIFGQYKASARGFAYARKIKIKYSKSTKSIVKSYIHLVSSALFAKDIRIAFKGVNSLFTILVMPISIMFNWYIRFKIKKEQSIRQIDRR